MILRGESDDDDGDDDISPDAAGDVTPPSHVHGNAFYSPFGGAGLSFASPLSRCPHLRGASFQGPIDPATWPTDVPLPQDPVDRATTPTAVSASPHHQAQHAPSGHPWNTPPPPYGPTQRVRLHPSILTEANLPYLTQLFADHHERNELARRGRVFPWCRFAAEDRQRLLFDTERVVRRFIREPELLWRLIAQRRGGGSATGGSGATNGPPHDSGMH